MDLVTTKSHQTTLVYVLLLLLIFAWISQSAGQQDVPNVTISPPTQNVVSPKSALFICSVSGNPVSNISWSYKGTTLTNSTKHDISTSGNSSNLLIKDLARDDSGNYTCYAKNAVGNDSKTSELVVLNAPTVTISPPTQEVVFPESAQFSCGIFGNPVPDISWSYEGITLTDSTKYDIKTSGNSSTLLIKDLARNDSGNYRCFAKNAVGNDSKTSELVVLSSPDAPINLAFVNTTANSITIRWNEGPFDGNRPVQNFIVTILEDGKSFQSFSCNGSREDNGNCIYTYPFAYFSHLKVFTTYNFLVCSNNSIGKRCTDGYFNVTTSQDAPDAPRNLSSMATSSRSLHISWKPPAVLRGIITEYELKLCLTSDGNDVEQHCRKSLTVNLPGNVTTFNTNASDEFMCAYCQYNIVLRAKTIKLGPKMEITGRTKQDVPGKPTNVNLNVISYNGLRLTWGQPSQRNGEISGYYITWRIVRNDTDHIVYGDLSEKIEGEDKRSFDIPNLEPHSEYVVTINAISGAGNGSNVTVRNRTDQHVPSAPINVKVTPISSSQINVTWQPPLDPNGVISNYTVTWRMVRNDLNKSVSGNISTFSLNSSARVYLIEKLEPYSEYSVSVNAVTNGGSGPAESKIVRTKQSTPGQPRSPQLISISFSTLSLAWLSPSDPNGIITGYRVIWKLVKDDNNVYLSDSNSIVKVINNESERSFSIENLEPYSEYNVSLNAMTVIGNGSKVNLTSRTNQSTPGKPDHVQLNQRPSPEELKLTWQRPSNPNGVITGYLVTWRKVIDDKNNTVNNGLLNQKMLAANRNLLVITELEPYSSYNVTLNAITVAGNGTIINKRERTREAAPGVPDDVQLNQTSSAKGLILTWKPPLNPNGVITGYLVTWRKVMDDNNNPVNNSLIKQKMLATISKSLEINELEPYSWYNVSLNAVTAAGNGTIINKSKRTREAAPGVPDDVQLNKTPSAKRLKLTWQPPLNPNGVITGYLVTWRRIKDDNNNPVNSSLINQKMLAAGNTSLEINDLEPHSFYNVSLNAITVAGNGTVIYKSERTREAAPGVPDDVQLKQTPSVKELELSWKPPLNPNGVITNYSVTWRKIKDDKNYTLNNSFLNRKVLDANSTSFLIKNLDPYSVYNVSLNAITSAGDGKIIYRDKRTGEAVPSEPRNLRAFNVSSTALNVSWHEPQYLNGILTTYTVYYKLLRNDKNEHVPQVAWERKVETGKITVLLPDLKKYSLYEIKVSASTNAGEGKNTSHEFRTAEDTPDRPRRVELFPISSSILGLSWQEPEHPNGLITGYNVTWKMVSNDKKKPVDGKLNETIRPKEAISFAIEYLEPYSEYNVTLNAITSVGNGVVENRQNRTRESTPSEPQGLSASNISSTELEVNWTAPERFNGEPTKYTVYYKRVGNDKNEEVPGEQWMSKTTIPTATSVQLPDLEKYSVYNVKVSASTKVGEGKNTTARAFRTKEDKPGVPAEVNLVSVSFSELRLTWKKPGDPNGIIRGYIVTWKKVLDDRSNAINDGNIKARRLGGEDETFSIDHLDPYSVYNITLNAFTGAGNGTAVDKSNRTDESVPGTPDNLQASNVSSTELNVTWIEPLNTNGILEEYTVYYKLVRNDNNREIKDSVLNSSQTMDTTIILSGLEKYSVYDVKVSASTKVGEGKNTTIKAFRTKEDKPGIPVDVNLVSVSFSELRLTWKKPEDPNGVIRGYIVTWKKVLDDRSKAIDGNMKARRLGGEDETFSIDDLDPYSVYNITLNAFTGAGNGTAVDKSNRTDESVPDTPRNLQASNVSSTELNVTWSEPLNTNGILEEYTVYYKLLRYGNNTESRNAMLSSSQTMNTSIILSGLGKYSEYEVKVSASTSKGNGNSTAAEKYRTEEDIPGRPGRVRCAKGTKKFLNVSWSKPADPNGIILNYTISWKKNKNKNADKENPGDSSSVGTTNSMKVIGNNALDPYTVYDVYVKARTSVGLGEDSKISCDTAADIPKAAPEDVRAVHLDPYSALVRWTTINRLDWQDKTIEYVVSYKRKGQESTPQEMIVANSPDSQVLRAKLTDLTQNSSYVVYVSAQNTVGVGEKSKEVPFRTNSSTSEDGITSNTIPFDLKNYDNPKVSIYQILVLKVLEGTQLPDVNEKVTRYYHNRTDGEPYITAEFRAEEFDRYRRFKVGGGNFAARARRRKKREGTSFTVVNGPLDSGSLYRLLQRGLANDRSIAEAGKWTGVIPTPMKISTNGNGSSNVGVIVAVIVVIVLIIVIVSAVLLWLKRRNVDDPLCSIGKQKENIMDEDDGVNRGYQSGEVISVSDFSDHCRRLTADSNYLYSQEYSQIPRKNASHTMHHALQQSNRDKNRYNNILCYDLTRVTLKTDPTGADYINASFLDGFEKEKAYIASQGPLENTCEDFWRMVWENVSSTIVMVTGLEEGRKIKCHQYWPSAGTQTYGQFNVTLLEEIELTDYTIRTFTLSGEDNIQERLVKQFHYTAWPDHGVPSSPSSLLNFVRKSSAANPPNAGPMVVHCSAGVGRTGTYIVLDTQLKRIAERRTIDVYGNVQKLRNQRVLMVQVEDQYVFIHNVLLEAIHSGDTEIRVEDFAEAIKEIMDVNPETGVPRVEEEFQRLGRTVVPPAQFKAANMSCNKQKNRYANVLPYDESRVKLCLIPGAEGSDYINANYIDGYMKKKAFIGTQAPIPDTISDFWRMVWQESSLTIVMLSNEMESGRIKVHRYWPNKAPAVIGDLMVELTSEQKFDEYVLREFKLTNTKEKASHVIRQFHYNSWPDVGSPSSGAGMIDLIGQVQRWQQQSGNKIVTVHCSAGVGRTGVFCALSNLIERLKTEHVIDVFQTVKMLRQKRPAMVQTKEQYEFCYNTLQEYLDSFDLYANFT